MSNKSELRMKLRATIEANRITRLPEDKQDEYLEELFEKRKRARGLEKKRINILIDVIEMKQAEIMEKRDNINFVNYAESFDKGGGGSGTDNG